MVATARAPVKLGSGCRPGGDTIRPMRALPSLVVLALLGASAVAAADGALPASVTLPASPSRIALEKYGQATMKLEPEDIVVAGRHWSIGLDAAKLPGDGKQRWSAVVDALKRGGWQVMLDGRDWGPPYVTMKRVDAGKETWMSMWVFEEAALEVVEVGPPSVQLKLAAPTTGIAKVADGADFPQLGHFPGSKLASSAPDTRPLMLALDPNAEPVMVAAGGVVKSYTVPAQTSPLEQVVVYRDALKAAGWTMFDVNVLPTTSDPSLTAHYAAGAVDLWCYVHTGEQLAVEVFDAGGEREAAKLKAELDRSCRVAIYGVNFDFDKATLRPDAGPALESIRKLLTDFKELKVELGGHTDNVGERGYNQKLSETRVGTVKSWLTEHGVAGERLTTKGYADTQPIASNDAAEGRAKNRRVELRKLDCKR
jgi:outer membrane protein OmpA-like peptidoglycan-associated protein